VLDVAAEELVEVLHLRDVLELVERDQHAGAASLRDTLGEVEQRVERRQRVGARLELELDRDAGRAEREPEPGRAEDRLDRLADRPLQLRVGALDPDRHVRVAEDAVQVDQHRHQVAAGLGLRQRLAEEARLAEAPRRVEAHVVPARGKREELLDLRLPVEHVLRRQRTGVNEGVDLGHALTLAPGSAVLNQMVRPD
jgi:hypothetical protein